MQPGVGAVTPRYDLLGAYHQFERGGFVADLVLPALDVPGRRGYFGVVPKGVFTAYVSTLRAPKGSPSRSQWTPSSDSYSVKEYSHEMPTDIQEIDEYQGWFNLLEYNTMLCAGVVELDIEKTTADLVMNDTTFPADGVTGATVSTAWSTWASATPIQDLITGFNALRNGSGCEPNAFICTVSAFNNITNTAEFRDRAKYVGITPGNATKGQFLSVLGGAMEDAGLVTDNFQVILPWAR
ncbi:MAG TPA: hypothetical protein PLW65_20020, partial [Pseudomonadota bacterium]|nr:hypothetical protein [Pseudomonadota bacterium]